MYAAVVSSFDSPPRYEQVPAPTPTDEDEVLVDVVAAGLHPRVRSQANGSHYTSTDELPLVPGVDGVGRLEDGSLVYFVLPDTTAGSMAEQTVIDRRRSVVLPAGTDPVLVAAAMNPGMSSWVALRRRIDLQAGQSVLVLGATGNAGQLAIRIAKHLGAGRVIGAGRDAVRLAELPRLGADATVSLAGDDTAARLGEIAADVDVVIDYVWGTPALQAMTALAAQRADPAKLLRWIQIGALAGPDLALPSALLRSTNVQILGSGQGSASARAIVGELPALAAAVTDGTLGVRGRAVPLREVETAWATGDPSERVVLVP